MSVAKWEAIRLPTDAVAAHEPPPPPRDVVDIQEDLPRALDTAPAPPPPHILAHGHQVGPPRRAVHLLHLLNRQRERHQRTCLPCRMGQVEQPTASSLPCTTLPPRGQRGLSAPVCSAASLLISW